MDTLKFKALFIRTAFNVVAKAMIIYLLITLPLLGVPVVYLLSAMYAVSFGWVAGFVFMLAMLALQYIKVAPALKIVLLYASVLAAVTVAYQMIAVLHVEANIWRSEVLVFPGIAVAAGWISVAIAKKTINALLLNIPANPVFRKKQTASKYFLNNAS